MVIRDGMMSAPEPADCRIEVFRRSQWLLSTAFQAFLLDAAKVEALMAGQSSLHEHTPNWMFCVLEGAVGPTQGRIVAHISPGRCCSEMSLFEDSPGSPSAPTKGRR
jgi:hypothetical protein